MEQTILRLDNWGFRKVVDTPLGVEILSVSNNRLKALGAITACISLLELNLSGNRFEEAALIPLAQFRNLRKLDVSNNRILGLGRLFQSAPLPPDGRVEKFSALENLNVSENAGLSDVVPALTLRKLRKLQASGIGAVRLTCTLCTTLEVLEMDRCSLAMVDHLSSLSSLRTLVLDGNAIMSGSGVLEASHPRLETLRLASNAIHELPSLSSPYLTTLDLSSNQLSQLPLFIGAQNIKSLSLSNNSLISLASLAPLRFLKFLDVSNNMLPGLDPSMAVGVLPSLQVLDLSSNKVEHLEDMLSVLSMVSFPAIEHLDVRNNPFTFAFYPEGAGCVPRWSWDASMTLNAMSRLDGITLLDTDTQLELETYRSLIARTCPSLCSLDGLLVTEGERTKRIEKAAQASPFLGRATVAVQSEMANARLHLVENAQWQHQGLEVQRVPNQRIRENDEVLYSTPHMSTESIQQHRMVPPWPSAVTDMSMHSESFDRDVFLTALQENKPVRTDISGSVVFVSPPEAHLSARHRERSQSSSNVARQRSITASPVSRLSFEELHVDGTDIIQSPLPNIETPLLLPSLALQRRESDGVSYAGSRDFDRRPSSRSATSRDLLGANRSLSTSGSPPRSALRSASERDDMDPGSIGLGSDFERRRISTTSTICESPARSALRSVSERLDTDVGSIGVCSVDLERRRVSTTSTICGSTPRSARRPAPERRDTDASSVGFCGIDLEGRMVSPSSIVRDIPSTRRPTMSPTPASVSHLSGTVNEGGRACSFNLEPRKTSASSIIRGGTPLGSRESFGEMQSRSAAYSASFPSQHSYVLAHEIQDSRNKMNTPVVALHFQTPSQSGHSFARYAESPPDPANAEALPRPRGGITVGTANSYINSTMDSSLSGAMKSEISGPFDFQPWPLAKADTSSIGTKVHEQSPRRESYGVDSTRRQVKVESQSARERMPLPLDAKDVTTRVAFTPSIAKSPTSEHQESVPSPLASRNAYLQFLENEIASQRAFLKLRRDGRSHGAPSPRHFASSSAQPPLSTTRMTPRPIIPASAEAMRDFAGFKEDVAGKYLFAPSSLAHAWQHEGEGNWHQGDDGFLSHDRRPKIRRHHKAAKWSAKNLPHDVQAQRMPPNLCWEVDSGSSSAAEVESVKIAQVPSSTRKDLRKVRVEQMRDPSPASSISGTDSSVRSCSLSGEENPDISWQTSVKPQRGAKQRSAAAGAASSSAHERQLVEGVVTGPLFFKKDSMVSMTSKQSTGSMAEFSQALVELQEFSSRTPAVPSELLRDVKITETDGTDIKHNATKNKALDPLMKVDGAHAMSKDKQWHAVVTPVKPGARQLLEELIGQQAWAVPGRPVMFQYFLCRAVQTEVAAAQSAFQTLTVRDASRTDTTSPYGRQQQRAFFCGDGQRLAEVIASPFGFAATYEGMVLLFAFDLRHAEALSAKSDWSPCDCGASAGPKFAGRTLVAELALGNCHTADVSLQDALRGTSRSGSCAAVPMAPVFEAAYRSGADSLYFPQAGVFAILNPMRALPQFLVEYRRDRTSMLALCGGIGCSGGAKAPYTSRGHTAISA